VASIATSPVVDIDPDNLVFPPVTASAFTSPGTADPAPSWTATPFVFQAQGLSVPPDGCIYLRLLCSDAAGVGTGRDDFAVDDLSVTPNPSLISGVDPVPSFAGPFHLGDVHPNPFNPQATLDLQVKQDQTVTISAYDLAGRLVRENYSGTVVAGGVHTFTLHGEDLGSGIYFIRAVGEDFTAVRKAMVLK